MAPSSDLSDAVTWSYRLLLGREPEGLEIVGEHVRTLPERTVEAVRQRFIASPEFARQVKRPRPEHEVDLQAFAEPDLGPAEPGFYIDVTGVRTRVSYLPPTYARFGGMRAGDKGLQLLPLHDKVELAGMVEAANAAESVFTVLELGAGWGPWISMGAAMAMRRGLDYRLIAVEGSEEHVAFLQTHVEDNHLQPDKYRLIHAIVGAIDGVARFPKLSDPSLNYGASVDQVTDAPDSFSEVPSFTIATLLKDEPVVDVLHCDIQGHESVALRASIDALDRRVRRVIVGTHGRGIEEELHSLFSSHGWVLDKDLACTMSTGETTPVLRADGAQYWVNTALA